MFNTGDPELIERVDRHIERHVAPTTSVFHEIVSDELHIDVHWVKPGWFRRHHTLVTSGRSELPMNTPEDLFDCPHLSAVGMFPEVEHPTEGRIRHLKVPVHFSKTPGGYYSHAERLGASTEAVLQEVGYSDAEIEELQSAKAAGKLLGGIPTPGRDAGALYEAGYDLVIADADVTLLRDAACASVASLRAAAGRPE